MGNTRPAVACKAVELEYQLQHLSEILALLLCFFGLLRSGKRFALCGWRKADAFVGLQHDVTTA